jgi:hypothetical protein
MGENVQVTAGCASEIARRSAELLVIATDLRQTTVCGVLECPALYRGGESINTAKLALGECVLGNLPVEQN